MPNFYSGYLQKQSWRYEIYGRPFQGLYLDLQI